MCDDVPHIPYIPVDENIDIRKVRAETGHYDDIISDRKLRRLIQYKLYGLLRWQKQVVGGERKVDALDLWILNHSDYSEYFENALGDSETLERLNVQTREDVASNSYHVPKKLIDLVTEWAQVVMSLSDETDHEVIETKLYDLADKNLPHKRDDIITFRRVIDDLWRNYTLNSERIALLGLRLWGLGHQEDVEVYRFMMDVLHDTVQAIDVECEV